MKLLVKRFLYLSICLGMLLGGPAQALQAPPRAPGAGETVFLPMQYRRHEPAASLFGIDLGVIGNASALPQMVSAGATRVRRGSVNWAAVEPTQGARNWAALAALEQELSTARENYLQVILIVSGTPDWAQGIPPYSCGPIKAVNFADFAAFLYDLVQRYKSGPYFVKHWEIWNEPDVAPEQVLSPDSPFGCWGDMGDDYFGGSYYADMLKVVYPAVKAADPAAKVLVGGLLLDCNPDVPGTCVPGKEKPPRFFEGILRHHGANDGAEFFDGVSFHAYDFYGNGLGRFVNGNWGTAWNTTGPVFLEKAAFLRSLIHNPQYYAGEKFLINTELAMVCPHADLTDPRCAETPTSDFARTKAAFLARAYLAARVDGVQAAIWYDVFGWRGSGLIDPASKQPYRAYYAFDVASDLLHAASFVRTVDEFPGLQGYEFTNPDGNFWALWSQNGTVITATLPQTPTAVLDPIGAPLTVTVPLEVGWEPVYILWSR